MKRKPKPHECPAGKGIPDSEWPSQSKASCNCDKCKHKNCPDLMKRMGLCITSGTNVRGKCVKGKNPKEIPLAPRPEKDPSILGFLNQNRDCNCEIMARAIRSPVKRNKPEELPENSHQMASNSKKP